jgi:hypothetical protein
VLFTLAPIGAAAQTSAPASPAVSPMVSPATLDAIRRALENPPDVTIDLDGNGLRFQMQVLARQKTFADYLRGTDITFGRPEPFDARKVLAAGVSGGGFDVLPLILGAVRKAREARRNYQIRRINEQIDRELAALAEAQRAAAR